MSKLDELLKLGVQQPESEQLLGVEFIEASEGKSTCKWLVSEKLRNGNGVTLGGYVTSAADIGMAYAMLSVIEMNSSFTTLSINTTFHRPALVGEIMIHSSIKRLGKTTAYVEAELFQNDKLIASATSTVMQFPVKE
ncbi:MAG: PaaI family thioesterase [Kurthia sp.]|nr:PaaI family thioesterase [Candidatus Kurthia equi]